MNNTKRFQKIATNETIAMEVDDDIKITKITQNKTKTYALCLIASIFLLAIGFVFGYFINEEINNNNNNDIDNPSPNSTSSDYFIRDKSCLTRKCCQSKHKISHKKCNDLFLIDCVSESQYCEWNCNPSQLIPRERHFYGISTGIGSFPDSQDVNSNNNNSSGIPTSVDELIEMSKIISIDDCGVMYEERMDYERAVKEFEELKNLTIDEETRRRMQGGGLIGSDNQVEIGNSEGGGLVGSQQSIGCITYSSGNNNNWGQSQHNEPTYYYDHICSGTLIAPNWVLTSGQCCHPGYGGNNNYYGNWYYYPEIKHYNDISIYRQSTSSLKAYKVLKAYSYSAWINGWGNKYDWDICVLQLQYSYHGHYIHLAYQNINYNNWNSLGYRYDKYNSNDNYLIYGWTSKSIYSYNTYYFSYTMDAYDGNTHYSNGYAGSPLYYQLDNKQYCVVSNQYNRYGNKRNYCTRISTTTYTDFCGTWWSNGQQYYGYGYGYCN